MSSFRADDPSSRSNDQPWSLGILVFFFLLFVALFLLLRVNRLVFLILLLLIVMGGGLYYWYQERLSRQRKSAHAKSTKGLIQTRLRACSEQIRKNREEIKDIRKSIYEMEERLKASKTLKTPTVQESEKLIKAFQKELELRASKIRFYESCQEKLTTLGDNHRMLEEINEKQQQLRKLQESHYEDLADMESMRSQLEFDKTYLETIDTLSLRMLESHSIDRTQQLELELKQMTKELRRL